MPAAHKKKSYALSNPIARDITSYTAQVQSKEVNCDQELLRGPGERPRPDCEGFLSLPVGVDISSFLLPHEINQLEALN